MRNIFRSFPLAFKMIFTDPVNIILAIIPSLIALSIYLFMVYLIYQNVDAFILFFKSYISTAENANLFAKILTTLLIIFTFFVFSWTFILVVGLIASPFNSLLSSRIEQKINSKMTLDENSRHAISLVRLTLRQTFKNELKKIFFLSILGLFAFFINLIPVLYPLAAFIISILFAIQFVDYSWSRHNLSFKACLKDLCNNIFLYFLSGLIFLALISVPIINAFVPALATSYFTVLWLHQKTNH